MKRLRKYIREILAEGFKRPNLVADHFAIWTDWQEELAGPGIEFNFVMYDSNQAKQWFDKNSDDPEYIDLIGDSIHYHDTFDPYSNSIKAIMRIKTPDEDDNLCNGAWEVTRSAAVEGYGPTLYDLVMSISPYGLTSDRSEVSKSAEGVWKFYANNRDDVDKKFLDPIETTYFSEDDCKAHGQRPADAIRKASRLAAMHWFDTNYPELHTAYLNDVPSQSNGNLQFGDGKQYYHKLVSWLEYEQKYPIPEDWNEDNFMDWYNAQQHQLIDWYDDEFVDAEPLNLSYNTTYASDIFYEMTNNHEEYMEYVINPSNMVWEIDNDDLEDYIFQMTDEVQTVVRAFFRKHYKR